MKINQMKKVQVDIKTVQVHVKVCDSGSYAFYDQDGAEVASIDDYVPSFFPGQHYGDYLILNIDIDTGKITNWNQPTAEQLESLLEKDE